MHKYIRFLIGVGLGSSLLAGYLYYVGIETITTRVTAVAPTVAILVFVVVVMEGLVDGIGVWASIAPLGEGITVRKSIQFALAGDFFDILSPTGPVGSEPIMARFYSVTTNTGYAEALGVRSTAKYVKSGAQIFLSSAIGLVMIANNPSISLFIISFSSVIVILLLGGFFTIRFRGHFSKVFIAILTPLLNALTTISRSNHYDRSVVTAAVERYWERVLCFRRSPQLIFIIALGGILEQILTATAIWIALGSINANIALLPIIFLIPFPQVARVFPIPGSLGAYDILLVGAIVLVTSNSNTSATAAVILVRTFMLLFGAGAGGLCISFLKGWKPTA